MTTKAPDNAPKHTPTPWVIESRNGGTTGNPSAWGKEGIWGADNTLIMGHDGGWEPELSMPSEADADLLAAAVNSYDKHCGARAVECAEADLLGALLSALEAVEWVEDEGHVYCPWCKGMEPSDYDRTRAYKDGLLVEDADRGHKPDCQRQAALAHARGEQPDTRGEGE